MTVSQELRDKILKQIPSDPRKTKQLLAVLNLAADERTEISLNTRRDDGNCPSCKETISAETCCC